MIGAATDFARAQQYFNGAQTIPNVINGGNGVWDTTTTNWTDATGATSTPYDPTAGTTTVFGASGSSTPATGGIVTVGPGGVQFTGLVQFQATGDNSIYTIQGGSLTVAAGGTTFDVSDVSVGAGPSAVISSAIVGNDGINVQGAGTLVLNGASTYTGGTFICGCASLQLGDATHTASIVGAVTNEGLFDIVNANTAGIASITNDSSGETHFRNTSTASTTAIVNQFGGRTEFHDFSSAMNANITNESTGGRTLFFDHSTAGNASITNRWDLHFNDFSNAGSAAITNRFGGEIDFNGNSNAGSATIVNRFGARMIFNDNSSAMNANITNRSGGAIDFNGDSNAGSATIVNRFGALMIFNDNSSAMNANITNRFGGAIAFSDQSTAGSAVITTLNGAATFFNGNSTGDNAQFITNGTGFVEFSGSSGPNGDGVITAGSIAGSGTYYIGGDNTLVVGRNNLSTEVSGVIDDGCGCSPGNLEKVGAGTLTLSGPNTYTGTTTINGGFLDVEGSISASSRTIVNAGGALTGAGIVGNTTIANGGIFLPGNGAPGSALTVAGNLAFQSGALYLVTLNSTASTFANVTGTAALGGTVGTAFVPGSTIMKQYKILTAIGGVSGGFNGVAISGGPGGLVASFSDDGTNVFLNFTVDFNATPGLNTNQRNVGNALANFFNVNGGIPAMFGLLTPAGLTQVSGGTATGSQPATFQAMSMFLGLMTDPFVAGTDTVGAQPYAEAGNAYAAARLSSAHDAFAKIPTKAAVARNDLFDPRWSVWGAAYGGGADIDGNAALGSNSASVRAFGFVGGADYRISPSTLAGFALGGGGTSFSVNGFGNGRSDLFQAGAFVRHTIGAAYVTGALAYGGQQVTTDRTVTVAGLDRLHAQFNAHAVSGRIEGGTRFATPWMGITPYAAAQFTTFSLPAYAEQALVGNNAFALNYAAKNVTASRTELGVRTDRSFALESAVLTLRSRFAWAHDFNTDRNVTAVFQALPGASFVVNGAAQARDSALTTASAEMTWRNGWSTAATFEGEFSAISRSYAGKGVVRYAW